MLIAYGVCVTAVQVPTKIIPEGVKHIPWNEAPLGKIFWFGPRILTFFFLPPHIFPLYISSLIEACPVLQVHGHNELPKQAIILYGEESYALFKYLPSVYLIFKWLRPLSFLSQNLLALTTTCLNNTEMFSFVLKWINFLIHVPVREIVYDGNK